MKRFVKILILLVIGLATTNVSIAQESSNSKNKSSIGFETQVYPTGIIPCVRYELPLNGMSNLHFRIGYQIIDHRDLGVQADETGSGYGFSLGYKRFLNQSGTWSLMLKNDFWINSIDWEDFEIGMNGEDVAVSGTSDILVLQPTLQAEYNWAVSDHLFISPSVAFGLEWNVKTEGRPTGEGPILLVGVSLSHSL